MNLSNLRDDVEPLQTRADEIALNSTISGARFSSGNSTKGSAFTISSPGRWDQGNNRLKTVSCRNHLDQPRHADGTSLLCPPHFVLIHGRKSNG